MEVQILEVRRRLIAELIAINEVIRILERMQSVQKGVLSDRRAEVRLRVIEACKKRYLPRS
jgi:hypothetical protein